MTDAHASPPPAHPAPAIGLLLPTREAEVGGALAPADLVALAVEAERLGWDTVWAGESPLARPRLDALTLLAAVAARTGSIGVGTAVLLPALRSPVLLAHQVASLDRLAGGRLTLGVGSGFAHPATEAEFRAVGVPFDRRIGRLVETVRICRQLWTADDPSSFAGRHWTFDDVDVRPKPARPGGPPLWLAGATAGALARAGRLFDGWLPYSPTPADFAAGLDDVRRAALAAGRPPAAITPALYATLTLDDDPARAKAEQERYTLGYYGLPLEVMSQLQGFYAGSLDGAASWLGSFVARGARHLILRFGTLADPSPIVRRAAEELLPALRARQPLTRP